MLYFYNNYDTKTYTDAETSDNNALTMRVDAIFTTVFGLFNPTLYVSRVATDYVNDSLTGTQTLLTYGLNLNKPVFGGKWYLTGDYAMNTQTATADDDNYTSTVMTVSLDHFF